MRPVDTAALGAVAPSLGIGNPATVTQPVDFDDAVLQQVYDVSPIVRYGFDPIADGWRQVCFNLAMLTGIGIYNTTIPYASFVGTPAAPGIGKQGDTIWLYHLSAIVVASAAMADWKQAHARLVLPAAARFIESGVGQFETDLWYGNSANLFLVSTLKANARSLFPPALMQPRPMVPGAVVALTSEAVGAVGTLSLDCTFLCRALPPGVPPLP
ncbi:MAG: hypothetical protein OEM32_10175 [Acidimicrobiia bacterium]|nr:hypothetical protein [Acidimicrobiia bacterium]